MADRPIQVGDLVQVVRDEICACFLGHIGTVTEFYSGPSSKMHCNRCNKEGFAPNHRVRTNEMGQWPLPWLKRIPPLSELEGEKTQEDLRESA